MTLLNEVKTITIQISQFIHFQLRLRENTSGDSSIGFIVTNWSKSCNIYCKSRKEDPSCLYEFVVERAKMLSKVAGATVFKRRYGMIAFIVVDL